MCVWECVSVTYLWVWLSISVFSLHSLAIWLLLFSLCKHSCTSLCSIYLHITFAYLFAISFIFLLLICVQTEKNTEWKGLEKWGLGRLVGWLWGVVVLCLTKLKNGGSSFLYTFSGLISKLLSWDFGFFKAFLSIYIYICIYSAQRTKTFSTIFALFLQHRFPLISRYSGPKSQRTRFSIVCLM